MVPSNYSSVAPIAGGRSESSHLYTSPSRIRFDGRQMPAQPIFRDPCSLAATFFRRAVTEPNIQPITPSFIMLPRGGRLHDEAAGQAHVVRGILSPTWDWRSRKRMHS